MRLKPAEERILANWHGFVFRGQHDEQDQGSRATDSSDDTLVRPSTTAQGAERNTRSA